MKNLHTSAAAPIILKTRLCRDTSLVAAVRVQLGEEAFAAAWAAGKAMTTDQAIAYALDRTRHAGSSRGSTALSGQ